MTIQERINGIINNGVDCETDSLEKLVYLAYYIGREDACREVSTLYRKHLLEQNARAEGHRYHKMVEKILGNGKGYIYHSDYAQDMKTIFGNDETNF